MKKMSALLALILVFVSASVVLTNPVDQPRMEAAKVDLQNAKAELMLATNNKGGHKTKAINLVNQAVAAVNRGIAFDRRNNHARVSSRGNEFVAAADQPHMERALDHLRSARENLERATTDKGGHRARAIALINQAIDQVKLGIAAGAR